jgi:hypothetical protein
MDMGPPAAIIPSPPPPLPLTAFMDRLYGCEVGGRPALIGGVPDATTPLKCGWWWCWAYRGLTTFHINIHIRFLLPTDQ